VIPYCWQKQTSWIATETGIVSSVCPDGYVPARLAITEVAKYWFSHRPDANEMVAAYSAAIKKKDAPRNDVDALAQASPQPPIPEAALLYTEIWLPTVERLRKLLSQGNLIKAYYGPGSGDCREVAPAFWETPAATYVLDSGDYLVGKPNGWDGRPLNCRIFFRKTELAFLLSELQSPKKRLPGAKKPALVAAIRKLNQLTRKEQRKALGNFPELRAYLITDDVFRAACKQVPRPLGRPPKAAVR
jgi:hypothetical protein